MPKMNLKYFTGDDYEEYRDPLVRRRTQNAIFRRPPKVAQEIAEQDDSHERFEFTYQASRHERWWLLDSLGGFYEQQWVTDVLRMVRGGKEASVYQCRGAESTGAEYVAAKVYRPRQLRNLRNDSLYREGRANIDADGLNIKNKGMLHAIRKGTEYGKNLVHTSWLAHEYTTLQVLHAAGADVPRPYINGENAILMEYIGGVEVGAPTLSSIHLDAREARQLFQRVVHNIEIMLAHHRVHGDLSAYNILYWDGAITLIDFPQAIAPEENQNAYRIFERDVARVTDYFIHQGVKADPRRLAADLWSAFKYRTGPEIHPGLLDADDEQDRAWWQKQAGSGR